MKKNYKFIKIDDTTLIVGIDMGQNTHYGYLRTLMYEEFKSFTFSNNKEGFELLLKKIKIFNSQHGIKNVVIGMESTGNYWLPLAYYLSENTDYTIVQVNGKHTKRFKEVTDNTSNKTDQKDPKVIAQIVLIGSGLRLNLPQGEKAVIREYTRTRKAIMEDKKRVQNRVHALLSMFFPEINKIFKDISCKTCSHILKHYPTPEDVLSIPKEKLFKELSKISRGRFNAKKLTELIEYSKSSIGVKEGQEGYRNSLLAYTGQIDQCLLQIKSIEKQIEEKLSFLSEYNILRTLGIGKITIATIVSEIGDFKNFKTSKELLKFSGLNLVENSSGKHNGRKRISKIGNEHLRSILFFATLRLIKKGGTYYDLYQKHQEKGMEKKKAIIAITRKLLRTIHAMTKKDKIFINEYELKQFNKAA